MVELPQLALERCLIIAEAGVNHNGDVSAALRLIDAASEAGADVVKFQTFRAESLVTPDCPMALYQQRNTGQAGSQLEMLRGLELSEVEFARLREHCVARGIGFMSTPFDSASADFLDRLGMPCFKIGSGELTNHPLLAHVAGFGKPVILSTGMAYLAEVRSSVRVLRGGGTGQLILLHCVSQYPTPPRECNLRAMCTLRETFDVEVGFSDHTSGLHIPLAAVALGARVIEKHFTLDRTLSGPDHLMSLEPSSLRKLVEQIRDVEAALGDGIKRPANCELETSVVARRSFFAGRPLRKGELISLEMFAIRRPGHGFSPDRLGEVEGRRLSRDFDQGEIIPAGEAEWTH